MKFIISENRIKEMLSNILDNIHIRVVTDGKDMKYPSGKNILGNPSHLWNNYINEFGPIFLIKYDEKFYVAQYMTDGWLIVDEIGRGYSQEQFIDKLGLSHFGFDIYTLIDMVKNKT
jgi:hypothetical protein